MKRFFKYLLLPGLLLALYASAPATAQSVTALCVKGTNQFGNSCVPVAAGSGLPVNGVTTGTGIFQAATVGTSSAQVIAAGAAKVYLMLSNPSAAGGNTVYCNEGGAAVVAAAGTISLAPGQTFTMEGSAVDGGAWYCISTGASTPFTYGVK